MLEPSFSVSAFMPTAVLDAEGRICSSSASWRALCGYSLGQVPSLEHLFQKQDCLAVLEAIASCGLRTSSRLRNVVMGTITGPRVVDLQIWSIEDKSSALPVEAILGVIPLELCGAQIQALIASTFDRAFWLELEEEWYCGLVDSTGRPIASVKGSLSSRDGLLSERDFPNLGCAFFLFEGAKQESGAQINFCSLTNSGTSGSDRVFYLTRRDHPCERWLLALRPAYLDGGGQAFAFQLLLCEQSTQAVAISELTTLVEQHRMMLWRAGHDIRDPLNALFGVVQLLLDFSGRTTLRRKEMKNIVDASVKQISNILSEAATIPAIGGSSASKWTSTSVLKCLQAAKAIAEGVEPRSRVLAEEVSEDLYVKANETTLVEVFLNLLHNALKYSPADSQVWISAIRREGTNRIDISFKNRVNDGALTRTANFFSRGDERMIRAVPQGETGWGLSLSICQFLVSRLSGSLDQKRLADGSYFVVISLPLA